MSSRATTAAQALATVAALAMIGWGLWWATQPQGPELASGNRAVEAAPADGSLEPSDANAAAGVAAQSDGTTGEISPTAVPTATVTPAPTSTPVPDAVAFVDLLDRRDLDAVAGSPLPGCSLYAGSTIAGTIGLRCIEEWASVDVVPIAPGRIVHIGSAVAEQDQIETFPVGGTWSWTEQAALGAHVVVDHGPFAGHRNVQTVYARLSGIPEDMVIGTQVDPSTSIGTIDGPAAELGFSWWADNVRQDGAIAVLDGPDADTQRAAASALGPLLASPTDPLCPLSLGGGQLPGASRAYRSGTHQGIDFGCGTAGRLGHAITDGQVVFVVDDYVDPSVADREALLRNAGLAGFTPHWTLVMLYGNVVVIDHGEIEGAGRIYSIAAHLESVDPAVTLGSLVTKGQVLGELGNRGTNAAAQGLRGSQDPSLHLHWELFVDNWYLGSTQPPDVVAELITTALCDAADTPGCPAA